ncbi:MAG: GxxExxY protein [Kiritimatiellae bacterium]|nr:GxxExxY protein [Kiritimatiellia bacterium]
MTENEISQVIIGSAIEVHKVMGGPGLLEDVYEEALCYEMPIRGLQVGRQIDVPLIYKGHRLAKPLTLDVLVEEKVIVECKAAKEIHPVFEAQLLTYLRLTGLKLGLLINFGETLVAQGIRRVVNGL